MRTTGGDLRPFMATLVAAIMLCASLTVILASSDSEAAFANLAEGDQWALSGERDLSLEYATANSLFAIGDEDSWMRNATIYGFSVEGKLGSYALFEVLEVTSDEYVIRVTSAQTLTMAVLLSMEGELAAPGSYIYEWYSYSSNPDGMLNVSEASGTVQPMGIDGKIAYGSTQVTTYVLERSSMGIRSINTTMYAYANGYANLENYPNTTTDYDHVNDRQLINISYESFDSVIAMNMGASADISFEPALKMIKDSPSAGDSWQEDIYVNASMVWDGTIDVTGLPQNITEEMFSGEVLDWGITGFPIDLAKIYNPHSSGPQINNGTLEIDSEVIDPTIECVGNFEIDDPVLGTIDVDRYGFGPQSISYDVCPDNGHIVAMRISGSSGAMRLTFDMTSAPVSEVSAAIDGVEGQVEEKQTYDQITAEKIGGGAGLDLMLVIAVLIVAVLVLMLGYAFVRGYLRKPKA